MLVERIYMWNIECYPFEQGPIKSMTIQIVAKSRKEAELLVLDHAYRFFNQDMHYIWNDPIEGYRKNEEVMP
jgi:hypothetical protein